MQDLKHRAVTDRILQAFYTVYHALGYGFLEKVYENAMAIELGKMGVQVVKQSPITVYYDGQVVGEYYADLVVQGLVIVELKAVQSLAEEHEAQLLNYLKATTYEVGLVLNFGPQPEFKRKVYDNSRKGGMGWMKKE
jgi:GxxExxY protein